VYTGHYNILSMYVCMYVCNPSPRSTKPTNPSSYLFISTTVTSLFSRYLLIVVLGIYSLLKVAAEKGHARTGNGPDTRWPKNWRI